MDVKIQMELRILIQRPAHQILIGAFSSPEEAEEMRHRLQPLAQGLQDKGS